ncbi:hypothetical protein D9M70_452040 [compost metagenome]
MREVESDIFSAMRRRRPVTLISSTAVLRCRPAGAGAGWAPRAMNWSRSSWVMRPAGPVPATWRRSTPLSLARRRTAGEASAFSSRSPVAWPFVIGAFASTLTGCVGLATGAVASTFTAGCSSAFAASLLSTAGAAVSPSPAISMRTSGAFTATVSPTSAPSQSTVPVTGEGISTVALSVMTAASTMSSRTGSPGFTCHSTSSASATPSPTSGILITNSPISGLHHFDERASDARGAGEIVPFLGVRVGRVPARNAHDGRFEMVEAMLLNERGHFAAEA